MHDPAPYTPRTSVTVHPAESDGGHDGPLAFGFLIADDAVLIPDPPAALADPARRFLVRITRTPSDHDDVETLPVTTVRVSALDTGDVRAVMALLGLSGPSRYGAAAEVPEYTLSRLADTIARNDGDLWATYRELGYPITRPDSTLPGDGHNQPAWTPDHVVDDIGVFALGGCWPSRACVVGHDEPGSAPHPGNA
ncbi:hypothetical protein [Streptomyces sp. SID3343]|uniref:hypothetical protein n=1 Tax=Streptomyces sp. SID3343 TaxID=2690260 RepID=UPI00136B1675|nr:hypothetical protein [Streptomyces sp. SID3343]MYW02844.1 hypothetical protein [Streptomyces sp. SID3343]